jgi:hypothetical protein
MVDADTTHHPAGTDEDVKETPLRPRSTASLQTAQKPSAAQHPQLSKACKRADAEGTRVASRCVSTVTIPPKVSSKDTHQTA